MPQKKKARRKPSLCKNTKSGKCDGVYVVEYQNNAPIFVCDKCQDTDYTWHKFYTEYLLLYKENHNWTEDKNKISCVLGLFCSLYKKLYKTDYVFVPQNPNPYSSKEVRDVSKLLASFQNNAVEVGKYLVWCFNGGISSSAKITSFAYILTPQIIRRFKIVRQEGKKLNRVNVLPNNFIDRCRKEIPDIFNMYELNTIGDLSLLVKTMKAYNLTKESHEHKAINIAKECGVDLSKIGAEN